MCCSKVSAMQLLTARGVATLLNGRNDLFDELPINPDGYEQLYAYPLEQPIRIDGNDSDWEDILDYNVSFGSSPIASSSRALNQFIWYSASTTARCMPLCRSLTTKLYFVIATSSASISQTTRLTFKDSLGETRKIVIPATEPGVTTAYEVDDRWRYDIDGAAEPIPVLVETSAGYAVEFRVPLSFLGEARNFGLAVVVWIVKRIGRSNPLPGHCPQPGSAFGLVLLKSPEILRIIEGLGYSGANVEVIDVDGASVPKSEATPTSKLIPQRPILALGPIGSEY